ncbi:MAG: zinc ribbon domain-containing protein [Clostridia bacterium]|nr:zinc ribbon domain-containing protein [Clostridia bacterium]
MSFLLALLGGLIGILVAVGIVFLIIYSKIKRTVGDVQMGELKSVISTASNLQKEEYSRVKNVKGLTSLLEQDIRRDFPEFSKEVIFALSEKCIRKILNCIESRDIFKIKDDTDYIYIEPKIQEHIEDMKSNDINEKFDNIEFNRSAIRAYTKDGGRATIKISTSLGYFYQTNQKDKKYYSDVKKQTRYTTEFVYVYDESKFDKHQISYSVHCKNCGAPIQNLGNSYCTYCGTPVERINLKAWKITSCEEDYNI